MSSSTAKQYIFQCNLKEQPKDQNEDVPNTPEPYIASPELIRAVNLAIYLRRPLLLEGEAGCGKTRLARAVAYELRLPFYRWDVRSTSKAREGLYTYDAILRLHDVQVKQQGGETGTKRDPANPKDYRRFGPLGKAFRVADRPALVLIDEIDKADLDFPNDLLAVLDDPWKFQIPETDEPISISNPDLRPIVFITSNKEKGNLPAPFLRRCIYFFLKFPDEQLEAIVNAHYRDKKGPDAGLIKAAAAKFLDVRQDAALFKKPGTSEFLDWVEALRGFALPGEKPPTVSPETLPPYPSLLFKLRADWLKYTGA
ncbi:MAG: AAA family ATPase [Anaerolineae bacterium]